MSQERLQEIPHYNLLTGALIVGQQALAAQIEQSGPGDIVPLPQLLTAPDFPFTVRDFPKLEVEAWDVNAYQAFGHWALTLVTHENPDQELREKHLERLYRLGLGPGQAFRRRNNFDMVGLRSALDEQEFNYYEDDRPTPEKIMLYAANLATRLGRRPRYLDYVAASQRAHLPGPGPHVIKRDHGLTIAELNERIGYPNIHAWGPEQYVTWGTRVLRANDGTPPTATIIATLSKRDRGPSVANIQEHFDSLSNFQERVAQEKQLQEEASAKFVEQAKTVFTTIQCEGSSEEELCMLGALYALADALLPPSFSARQKRERAFSVMGKESPSRFIQALLTADVGFTDAQIMEQAKALRVYECVWGLKNDEHLRVPSAKAKPSRAAHKA
jgi:hypothetical protein